MKFIKSITQLRHLFVFITDHNYLTLQEVKLIK